MSIEECLLDQTVELRRIALALEKLVALRNVPMPPVEQLDPLVPLTPLPATFDPSTERPRAQTVAPEGTDMTWFSKPGAAPPPAAIEARKLADHPGFQTWAVYRLGVEPSKVADSVAFSLRFICSTVGATSPADFSQENIISRFAVLRRQFEDSPYAR
jgi:hypothetical protein